MSLLLDRGADVNAVNANGDTALHVAVSKGDELVRFLVEKGAKLDARTSSTARRSTSRWACPARGGRGRGGRAAGPATPGPVRESTAALLKELMAARGL